MMRRPDRRYSVTDLARMANVTKWKMQRRLKRLDECVIARDGMSLFERDSTELNAKKFVPENRLLLADPDFFEKRHAAREEYEQLRHDHDTLNRKHNALAADYRDFKKKAWEWFHRGAK